MMDVQKLYKHIEEEEFDLFSDAVDRILKDNESEFDDISKLCDLFLVDWNYIESWQYHELEDLIFMVIDGHDKKRGFSVLVEKMELMLQKNEDEVCDFFNMLMCSYENDDIELFAEVLKNKMSDVLEPKFKEILTYFMEIDDSKRAKNAKKIMERISLL